MKVTVYCQWCIPHMVSLQTRTSVLSLVTFVTPFSPLYTGYFPLNISGLSIFPLKLVSEGTKVTRWS